MMITLRGGGRGWFVALMIGWLAVALAGSSDQRGQETKTKVTTQHKPRLRHSRHLDGFVPIRKTYASTVAPYLAVKDNHKPIFTDCFNYKPSMKEEIAIGTNVFNISADDVDPEDQGGKVTYKLINNPGEKERFRVDPETGYVYTNDYFDHDEPSRQKEVYITVRASDNGHPQLDDACTIKILVEDINDNPPVFDKVIYSESVPQDLVEGREVMRISATDIDDGNNSIVHYALDSSSPDSAYFVIDPDNGVIFLNKTIDKPPGYKFRLSAIVHDLGEPVRQSSITLDITVVESNKKSPSFIEVPLAPIRLKENYSDFTKPIATIRAVSNIPEETKLQFELVQGQTEQTNKRHTFVLEPDVDSAYIKLGNHLDYEKIVEYTLTVRIQNNYKLAAETIVNILVEDVNDNIPIFVETRTGRVLENEPPGTHVMVVKALDYDGTSANNQITYSLDDDSEPFAIDPITGNITTLEMFDRETKSYYNIKVTATDNSESALIPGKHNQGQQVILIEIADKNDNPPHFTQDTYVAESIAENANVNELVTQVSAVDNDTASIVSYSIVAGNTYDAFVIKNITGEIRVNSPLDYENITMYNLDVRAFDGIFEDYCKVIINIENLNDNPPVFLDNYTKTIDEERLYDGCVVRVEAYDPDIRDRSKPQMIKYSLVKQEQKEFLSIDNTGCLRLTKPLDRDQPSGFAAWQILIIAVDHGGRSGTDSLRSTTEVILELNDINDNAPFLTNTQPVIVYENGSPGKIATLTAKDYDSPENGPPFIFALNESASHDIRAKFRIEGHDLISLVSFDREAQKEYKIPVLITDSGTPRMSGVSELTVVIGDRNDNPMSAGHSDIFVYVYKTKKFIDQLKEGKVADVEVGRVYVNDPDDWDLNDKLFNWYPSYDDRVPYFDLQRNTGMIIMRGGTPNGTYHLTFNVTEQNLPMIPLHWVKATVNITIKEIPEEAVRKSGSVRFVNVTAEEFISSGNDAYFQGMSMKDKMHRRLALLFNTSLDNVDVFTVMNKNTVKDMFLDVRFSAHGSPYYEAEKLNSMVSGIQEKLEHDLGEKIYMVHIDECLIEKEQCEDSCTNVLKIADYPLAVFTNKTSFVGVNANTVADCTCSSLEATQAPVVCFNGGTPVGDKCECPEGLQGPHCEQTSVGFHGDGWAHYPPPPACAEARITLTIMTVNPNALVFYLGPIRYSELLPVDDFMSLELANGFPVLLVNYGSGVARIHHTMTDNGVADGEPHLIEILLSQNSIELFVDKCKLSSCMSLTAPVGNNEILNVNGPLQLGGANVDLRALGTSYNWRHVPTTQHFAGCISNFTYNDITYNLGVPSYHKNADPSCVDPMSKAVAFSVTGNFLIVILVCAIVLVVLLVAVVVYRRRSDAWAEKELDDIRENIIAYEDEGGGEGDAGYDLQVLRSMYGTQPAGPEPPPFPRPPLPDHERAPDLDLSSLESDSGSAEELVDEETDNQLRQGHVFSPPAMFRDQTTNREDISEDTPSPMVTFRTMEIRDTRPRTPSDTRSRPQSLRIPADEPGVDTRSPGERTNRANRPIEEIVPLSPIVMIVANWPPTSAPTEHDDDDNIPESDNNDDDLSIYSPPMRSPQRDQETIPTSTVVKSGTISETSFTDNARVQEFPPAAESSQTPMTSASSNSGSRPRSLRISLEEQGIDIRSPVERPRHVIRPMRERIPFTPLSQNQLQFPKAFRVPPSRSTGDLSMYPPPVRLPWQEIVRIPATTIRDRSGTISEASFMHSTRVPISPQPMHSTRPSPPNIAPLADTRPASNTKHVTFGTVEVRLFEPDVVEEEPPLLAPIPNPKFLSPVFENNNCNADNHSIFPRCIPAKLSPSFPSPLATDDLAVLRQRTSSRHPPGYPPPRLLMGNRNHCYTCPPSRNNQTHRFMAPTMVVTENPPREFPLTRYDRMVIVPQPAPLRDESAWVHERPVFRDDHSPLYPSSTLPQHNNRGVDPDRNFQGVVGAAPDISGFLDDKKNVLDRDPDFTPLDDVRNYAFEGDGNTSGSLSSLASCTDDSDLTFHYLTSFGPRFRKLADLYGEDDDERPEESWC